MDISKHIAEELGIKKSQVDAVVGLLDEGNTIPFIARYRKEVHGGLDDEQLRKLATRLETLRNLEEKKEQVLRSIEEQGKLTEDLKKAIEEAETQARVDDLYLPYRPKRRTRATIAKEKGLEPLAMLILLQNAKRPIEDEAAGYISEEKGVASAEDAVNGALDIIAEMISETAEHRDVIRRLSKEKGKIVSEGKKKDEKSPYELYYSYEMLLSKVPGHAVMALNRGEKEDFLKVDIVCDRDAILDILKKRVITVDNKYTSPLLERACEDSYDRLIAPSIEREIRNELTDNAEDGAIKVFGKNLSQLLMQPPIAGHTVLGWDPGYKNGCKLAVVDATGKILDTALVFLFEKNKLIKTVGDMIKRNKVTLISLGNGTASRESEAIVCDIIKDHPGVSYVIVNEAGASVYSASPLATEEMPDRNVGERSAASMARRLQDPLAELVKMDPKAIGVGQYQHDCNQKKLGEALDGVVEDCVNKVGVDLNTASAPLLSHIAGINKTLAKNIVVYRDENGAFKNRAELLKVPKLGPKAYEQCAGFLRVSGDNILDNTSVHPESYKAAEAILKKMGLTKADIGKNLGLSKKCNVKELSKELEVGEMTLTDILKELDKPGRDPREDMPSPILRSDVLEMEDLKEGMILKGTVRNVIDFGAFVDIGVHQDGLVHISQMSEKRIKHPLDVVSVGDVVEVKVLSVDIERKRISLTMKV